MATRQLLAELVRDFGRSSDQVISLESVGGVDAVRRVRAGESFDLVVLAAEAVDELIADGRVEPGSRVDLARSVIAVAVRSGAPRPSIASEDAVREAVLGARHLSYSTGPSGVHLARLFERWGIAEEVAARTVQAPPGVPVGTLVAEGQVDLGFQQLSELMHLPGIDVLGPLPPEIQAVTVFSAGIPRASARAGELQALLDFMSSPTADGLKRRHGMEPAARS